MPIQSFAVDALCVQVYDDEHELALAVASTIESYLSTQLQHQQQVAIALATGNSQIQFLNALTLARGIDWSRISCLHLDEFLGIAADHPASFRTYLRERVQNRVHPAQFHYIAGDTPQPLSECDRYSQLLTAQPLALCCLGVGHNGHLAFNEPQLADFNDPYRVKLVKLEPSTRRAQVGQEQFANLDAVPQYAFTLTIPAILAAQRLFCIALGKGKAAIVKQMLTGAIAPSCPASILRRHPNATLCLDPAAASLL